MRRAAALLLFLSIAPAGAQAPAFEVASIRPSDYRGGPLRVTARIEADGVNFSNVTLRTCIQRAYGVAPYQVVGPDWTATERYMIVAKAGGPAPEAQIRRMLQPLLADRFKLVVHRESREIPVYGLVAPKGAGKLKAAALGDGATEIGEGDGGAIKFQRVSMDTLAGFLTRTLGRPVYNETRIDGAYDFQLAWAQGAEPSDAPSIFTALGEQTGLKLEGRKAPVEMLVIDRAERPSAN